jgi:hypothetical protein
MDPDLHKITHWTWADYRRYPASSRFVDSGGGLEWRLNINRPVIDESLRTALSLDGKLSNPDYAKFLDQAVPPAPPDRRTPDA